ncbi:DUF3388 domain-containing protein [Desulfuribacillus stibiiarsenatis]|uniref:DUF3388 domain-containing protein n=1 Tax=Desulfuribacillus stibiiarsenatis TaxID=1390249 RepID=UPI00159F2079|nr:DUF3388 domain-containing protein [Desulfuribacillus stibiiarsenatis]
MKRVIYLESEYDKLVNHMSKIIRDYEFCCIGISGNTGLGKSTAVKQVACNLNKAILECHELEPEAWGCLNDTFAAANKTNQLLLFDGIIVSFHLHRKFYQDLFLRYLHATTIVIEHPDIFLEQNNLSGDVFDIIFEIRTNSNHHVTYPFLY